MSFDHAQSPRLGQPTPVEAPGVQLVTLDTLPEVARDGQIVYLLDLDKFRVYDGVAWQNPTADVTGGTQTFVSTTTPTADNSGDLWMNPSTHELKVWNGATWVLVEDPAAAAAATDAANALTTAEDALGIANGKTTIWYKTTQPGPGTGEDTVAGDMWVNTVTNEAFRFTDATHVVSIQDVGISAALSAAGTAQATADEKIQTFHQDTEPSHTGLGIGDLWIDSSVSANGPNNVVKRWNGTAFVALPSGTGAISSGAIDGTHLSQVVQLDGSTVVTNRALDPVTGQPTGQGIDWDTDGLTTYDATGTPRTTLPTDDMLPQVFRGDAEIDHLTVSTLTTLQETDVAQSAVMTLQNSIAPPSSRPSISYKWNTLQFSDSGNWGDRNGLAHDGTYFYTARMDTANNTRLIVERWRRGGTSSASVSTTLSVPASVHGVTTDSTYLYVLTEDTNGVITLRRFDSSALTQITSRAWTSLAGNSSHIETGGYGIALGWDFSAGQMLLAQSRIANSNQVLISRYDWGSNAFISGTVLCNFTYQYNLSHIMYDSFDLGTARYIYGNFGQSQPIVVDTSGHEVSTEEWHNPSNGRQGMTWGSFLVTGNSTSGSNTITSASSTNFLSVGMPITGSGVPSGTTVVGWNGTANTITLSANATVTGSNTYSIGPMFVMSSVNGVFYTYEAGAGNRWNTTTNDTWYAAYTWTNGATETTISPVATFSMYKRAQLVVTAASPVTGATGAKIYLAQGATLPTSGVSSMRSQGAGSGSPPSRTIYNATFTPTNNPLTNGFGSGVPASFTPQVPGWAFYGDGTYAVGAIVTGDGNYVSYTPTLTATTTNPNIGSTGTTSGAYATFGGMCHFRATVTLGGSGINAGSGGWLISLPLTCVSASLTPIGWGRVSSGGSDLARIAFLNGTNKLQLNDMSGNRVNNTTVTWAAGDVVNVSGTFRFI